MHRQTRRVSAFRAAVAALIVALGARTAMADLANGGFEFGDFTNWSTSAASGGSTTVVGSVASVGGGASDPGTWTPVEGSYFAYLLAGAQNTYSTTSLSFSGTAGDTLTFNVFFDAADYLPFDDDGFVQIVDPSASASTLYAASVLTVGNQGSNGWTAITYSLTQTGTFTLTAGVRNISDSGVSSALGIDNVHLASVPEPSSVALFAAGLAGLTGLIAWRRNRLAPKRPAG